MVKSIDELKDIVSDGMALVDPTGEIYAIIKRRPNNIIQIHGRSVSWSRLKDLLDNGNVKLDIKESELDLFQKNKVKRRRPGAGRKPKKESEKNKPISISLSPECLAILDDFGGKSGLSRSKFIQNLIYNYFK